MLDFSSFHSITFEHVTQLEVIRIHNVIIAIRSEHNTLHYYLFLLHKLLAHKLLNFAIYRTVKFNQGVILKRESPLTS